MNTEKKLTTVIKHLCQDAQLAPFVAKGNLEVITPTNPQEYFVRLTRSIVYQQLSGKVAGTIFGRFLDLFPEQNLTPEALLALPHETLRGVGLSNAKANYVRNIATAVVDGSIDFLRLVDLPEEDVISQLSQIKGIGRWTVEMFLMFTMGREDVFSFGDLGLAKGVEKIYGWNYKEHKDLVQEKVTSWSPFHSYAALVLWSAVDNS